MALFVNFLYELAEKLMHCGNSINPDKQTPGMFCLVIGQSLGLMGRTHNIVLSLPNGTMGLLHGSAPLEADNQMK